MAFVFNLLLGIIGGDGCLSASRPVTKRAFFMLPISQIRASGGPFDLIEGDPPTLPFLDRRAAPVLLMRTAMLRVVDERRAGHAVRGCHNCSDGLVDPTAIAINEVLSGARSAFTGTGPDRRSTSSMKARQQRGDVMNQAASWQPSYQNEPCHSLRQNGRSTSVIGPASRRSALPSRAMRPSARSSSPLPASKNPHSARDSCTQQARRLSPSPRCRKRAVARGAALSLRPHTDPGGRC